MKKTYDTRSYYTNQLNQLQDVDYFKSIQIFDGTGGKTKHLNLNSDSIPKLIEFLNKELEKAEKLEQKDDYSLKF